jgi:hypothetical protein
MDAAGWLAHWADAEARYLAERDERYRALGGKIRAELQPPVRVAPTPVVLMPAVEVESDSCPVAAARRTLVAAVACGWSARITRAVAAVPRSGVVESYALRASRHGDERLWASWWGGGFNAAQYWTAGRNVEVLGWRTVKARRGVMDAIEGRRIQ